MDAGKCKACGGRGYIELFTSREPCRECHPAFRVVYMLIETNKEKQSEFKAVINQLMEALNNATNHHEGSKLVQDPIDVADL